LCEYRLQIQNTNDYDRNNVVNEILALADDRLYKAKITGKNKLVYQ
jgi:PleD family two-component response regulator